MEDKNVARNSVDESKTEKLDSPVTDNELASQVRSLVEEGQTLNGDWVTSRSELWAFYVYYIVSVPVYSTITPTQCPGFVCRATMVYRDSILDLLSSKIYSS